MIQEKVIANNTYYLVTMHIGEEGLDPLPEDPRLIKILPESLVVEVRRWLDTIITEPDPSLNSYAFNALCGSYGPAFGLTLRMWRVGREMPYGNKSSIRCQGASKSFLSLRDRLENVYWYSERHLLGLRYDLHELEKLEELFQKRRQY